MALQGVKRLNLHLQIHPGGYPLGSNWIMAQPAEASSACRMRGAPHETWTLIPGSDATQLHWVHLGLLGYWWSVVQQVFNHIQPMALLCFVSWCFMHFFSPKWRNLSSQLHRTMWHCLCWTSITSFQQLVRLYVGSRVSPSRTATQLYVASDVEISKKLVFHGFFLGFILS